jgi:prephenate dehydratase
MSKKRYEVHASVDMTVFLGIVEANSEEEAIKLAKEQTNITHAIIDYTNTEEDYDINCFADEVEDEDDY